MTIVFCLCTLFLRNTTFFHYNFGECKEHSVQENQSYQLYCMELKTLNNHCVVYWNYKAFLVVVDFGECEQHPAQEIQSSQFRCMELNTLDNDFVAYWITTAFQVVVDIGY